MHFVTFALILIIFSPANLQEAREAEAERLRAAEEEAERLADLAAEQAAEQAATAAAAVAMGATSLDLPAIEERPHTPETGALTLEGSQQGREQTGSPSERDGEANDEDASATASADPMITTSEAPKPRVLLSSRMRALQRIAAQQTALDAAERRRLDRPAPHPMFSVKLVNEKGRVCFAPELEAIEPMFLGLLDLPAKLSDVVQVRLLLLLFFFVSSFHMFVLFIFLSLSALCSFTLMYLTG